MQFKSVLANAHRVISIAGFDCIIVLHHGINAEDDTHSEILERNGLYASFWYRHAGGLIDTENKEAAE